MHDGDPRSTQASAKQIAKSSLPPFGVASAIALTSGVVLAMQLGKLPAPWIGVSLCVLGLVGCIALRRARWIGVLLFGFAWACLQGGYALSVRLP
ncbi:MAG TPA: hypothetical protein VGT79_05555, partial [Xanthomonadaceae bacterium]|nr:hypothetical protein [Xanthomonadaceae bacterium]